MSLKAFHIVFIALSFGLALVFGTWCMHLYRLDGQTSYLALGVSSFVTAALLIVYGSWFLKKLRMWGENDVGN